MEKRSDRMGSLMAVSFVDKHFGSCEPSRCNWPQRALPGVDSKGVKKTCRPGDTRDVNGGVAV